MTNLPTGITIRITAGKSNQSTNNTSNVRSLGRLEAFRNNNRNNPSLLSLPGFEGGFEGGFNPLPRRNPEGLDPNITALVNALTGANLRINHVE